MSVICIKHVTKCVMCYIQIRKIFHECIDIWHEYFIITNTFYPIFYKRSTIVSSQFLKASLNLITMNSKLFCKNPNETLFRANKLRQCTNVKDSHNKFSLGLNHELLLILFATALLSEQCVTIHTKSFRRIDKQ